VTSPEPVFRRVAKHVDVAFVYSGPPGRVAVDAELSDANGWSSTVPLAAAHSFGGSGYRGVVRLDLDALAARAAAGAKATGLVTGEVGVSVVTRIAGTSGQPFAPALKLRLTPLALTVTDAPLVVRAAPSAPPTVSVPRSLGLAHHDLIRVSTARVASVVLLLGSVLALLLGWIGLRRCVPAVALEDAVQSRYAHLLVEVLPMVPPPGRPVVDVTEFATLVRLAERYGLLIAHWSISGSTTYVVQEEAATYWFCTDPNSRTARRSTDLAQAGAVHSPGEFALSGSADASTGESLFEQEMQFTINANEDLQLCLMLIDLDDVASIRRDHGQEVGDDVVLAVAERLRHSVRPHDLVARLDADDFAILLIGVGPAVVEAIAKRILRTVNEGVVSHGHQVRAQASIGLVPAAAGEEAAALMNHALTALAGARAQDEMHLAWFAATAGPELGG
jgi:diguanylate cyclase (GGDEF)-like protein